MTGAGVGGTAADGVTGCAVATPGDGSAGSVVTETTGVGAGGFAARDDVPPAASASTAAHSAAKKNGANLFMLHPPKMLK